MKYVLVAVVGAVGVSFLGIGAIILIIEGNRGIQEAVLGIAVGLPISMGCFWYLVNSEAPRHYRTAYALYVLYFIALVGSGIVAAINIAGYASTYWLGYGPQRDLVRPGLIAALIFLALLWPVLGLGESGGDNGDGEVPDPDPEPQLAAMKEQPSNEYYESKVG